MRPIRLHPRVYSDIDEALAYTASAIRARAGAHLRVAHRGRPLDAASAPDDRPASRRSRSRHSCVLHRRRRNQGPHGYIYKIHENGAVFRPFFRSQVHLRLCTLTSSSLDGRTIQTCCGSSTLVLPRSSFAPRRCHHASSPSAASRCARLHRGCQLPIVLKGCVHASPPSLDASHCLRLFVATAEVDGRGITCPAGARALVD